MALYERINTWPPIYGIKDGHITMAATTLGRRIDSNNRPHIHIATWHAGQGQREEWLSPSEFASWRMSFRKAEAVD